MIHEPCMLFRIVSVVVGVLPLHALLILLWRQQHQVSCFDFGPTDLNVLFKCLRSNFLAAQSIPSLRHHEKITREPAALFASVVSGVLAEGCHTSRTTAPFIDKRLFFDSTVSRYYCVISERKYDHQWRGLGVFVVPRNTNGPGVHLMAPHPIFDGSTDFQAVWIFQQHSTMFRSLLIAGRHRNAFPCTSNCVNGSTKAPYFMTDPTHSAGEPFARAAISIVQFNRLFPTTFCNNVTANASAVPCGVIQLHGQRSCPESTVFLSAGLANSSSLYHPSSPPSTLYGRVKRMLGMTRDVGWTVDDPWTSSCKLAATQNVLGRIVNGVEVGKECSNQPDCAHCSGDFVHVEQGETARESKEAWSRIGRALAGL
ncbi:hypothetical protein BJ742DRAFT_823224 [Cladochytrium replicatum]|nr:hypothetical protein BJ742DRAFT_823224 [Cladochytrium replicatum]